MIDVNPQTGNRDRGQTVNIISHFPGLTETFVYREILALRALNRRISILSLHRPGPVVPSEEFAGLESIPVAHDPVPNCLLWQIQMFLSRPRRYLGIAAEILATCWRSPAILLKMFFCFVKATRAGRRLPEQGIVLHAHFCHLEAACAYFIHRWTGIPYLITNHVLIFHLPFRLTRSILENAAKLICDFEWNRQEHIRRFGLDEDHVVLIRGGLTIPPGPPAPGPIGDPPVILNVGRLRAVKGQAVLIEACAILKRKGIRFRCEIVGEGDRRRDLERGIRRRDLGDVVVLRGACRWKDLKSYYERADLFAFPAVRVKGGRSDGVPTVLLEAVLNGIPVVTTPLPGPGELIRDGDSGILVPERDPEALAAAIEQLLASGELRQRFVQNGWRRLDECFDIRKNAARLLQLTEAAAGKAPPRAAR